MNPSSIYAQNNALANYGQQQAANYTGQYDTSRQGALQAQQNLQNFSQNAPDYGQQYGQNLQTAEQQYGIDPAKIQQAQRALATTQTTMANLPQAVQQSANGRGLTGAQTANRLAQQASGLQGVLAGQGNSLNALTSTLGAAQNQAGTQTGYGLQGRQLQLGTLQDIYANAADQQGKAGQQIDYFNNLRTQGLSLNVQEQQAEAQAAAAYAQAAAVRQQTEMMAAQASLQNRMATVASPSGQSVYNYGNPSPNYGFLGTLGNIDEGIVNGMNSLGSSLARAV
jgi:hypothetical protein